MAERRMFAKTIIDSDAFLDMPLSTQALYFHLSMRADDDGFINNPKKIQRMIGASDDDLKLLAAKNFIIPFESGIVVIKHWKIHNYIQSDRYKETVYKDEKSMLKVKNNKAYTISDTECIQDGYRTDTQVRLGKDSIGKDSNIYCSKSEYQKSSKSSINYEKQFEELWSIYIRKEEKAKAYKMYNARLREGYSEEELLSAVMNYMDKCKKQRTEKKYIKLCSTFLGVNKPFTDYLDRGDKDGNTKEPEYGTPEWIEKHKEQLDFARSLMS